MTKAEISRKFDEIVDFSGVERYIDTPAKRYSSGMTVRLGFAIAAHLDPEILVVDEVLAVGDAEFQKKAIGKMQDVSKGEGRTVLFVSHNMASLRSLCTNGIVLQNGMIAKQKTSIDDAISYYLNSNSYTSDNINIADRIDRKGNQSIKIESLELLNRINNKEINVDTPISVKFKYKSKFDNFNGNFLVSINSESQDCITFLESAIADNFQLKFRSEGEITAHLSDQFALHPGRYYLNIAAMLNGEIVDHVQQALVFTVNEGLFFSSAKLPVGKGVCLVKQNWEV
jgi:lipopolysaccharide transport system ATP-binding protein